MVYCKDESSDQRLMCLRRMTLLTSSSKGEDFGKQVGDR